jgi:hypothetical protein
MALLKFGHAAVVTPIVCPGKWVDKKVNVPGRVVTAKEKSVIAKYDPSQWLLSHVSIMASVDVDQADHNDPKSNYLIKPEYSIFVNNNGDAWERELLRSSSKTFMGADNFVEHVQLEPLSKGKVIDVALRDVPFIKDSEGKDLTTLYVDILIATNRKHKELIDKISSGEYAAVSMGCFCAGTEITMSDGTKKNIEDVLPGDLVITHTGKVSVVNNIQVREKNENILKIEFEGDYKPIYVTKEHPFWGFKRHSLCACGCGETIRAIVRGGDSNFEHALYKQGHYARVVNPNRKVSSSEDLKNNPIKAKIELSWIKAGDLQEEDFLSYPISEHVISDINATVDKARFLGYFVAEGSYVKDVIVTGEENEYAVKCKICGNLYNQISTHLPAHNIKLDEYRKLYPDAAIKAIKNKSLIRASRKESLTDFNITKSRKNIGLEFSLGQHEYDTVNKEISELAERLWPGCTVLRYKKCVKVLSNEAVEFAVEYCGEYSDKKKFCDKVLYWPVDVLTHLVATWFIGDYACTVSKNMADQFRFILAKCGIRYNTYKTQEKEYEYVQKSVVNGNCVTEKVYKGIKKESYLHQINELGMNSLRNALTYAFDFKNKKLRDSNSRTINSYSSYNDGYFLRKIKKIEEVPFEGVVYNFEVAGDNSYIANDVAVHNCLIAYSFCTQCGRKIEDESKACQHIRYFKHNTFYDKNGVKRIVAELCGSKDDPDSCKFIDASWVRKPAFEGAVLRNILSMGDAASQDVGDKVQKAVAFPSFEYAPGMYLKAASAAAKDIVKELSAADAPPPPPAEPPADDAGFPEAPADAQKPLEVDTPPAEEPPAAPEEAAPAEEAPPADAAPDSLGGKMEAPGGASPGAPAPEPQVEEPKGDATVNEVKDMVKKQLLNQIRRELLKEQSADQGGSGRPLEMENATNSSLVKQAGLKKLITASKSTGNDRLHNGLMILSSIKDWKQFKKYGYNRSDVLGLLHFMDKNASKEPVGVDAVKALSRVKLGSEGLVPFFTELIVETGRKPLKVEAQKIVSWAKILRNFE